MKKTRKEELKKLRKEELINGIFDLENELRELDKEQINLTEKEYLVISSGLNDLMENISLKNSINLFNQDRETINKLRIKLQKLIK
jgi:hypothetical protein